MMSSWGGCTSASRSLLSVFAVSVLVSLSGCSHSQTDAARVKAASEENRSYNDAARFLAGLPSVAGSAYAELEKSPAWKNYSVEMTEAWQRAEAKRLQPVREFQNRELGGAGAKGDFVFYPFSGPDVLYMQGFYPNGSVYVLAGLEMPGTVLEPSGFESKDLEIHLDGLREGISSLFARSFFVTGEMSRQLRGQKVDGVLPVILTLLARSGNTIINVRHVQIEDDGKLTQLAQPKPRKQPPPGEKPDGLEVTYCKDGEAKQRKLYYFRLDLGPGLDINPSFLTFSSQFGKPVTLIKSASFLLHWKAFAKLRDYIVVNSLQIVQDDTGIRYEIFKKEGWKVRLYGSYGEPDRPFKSQYQTALRDAFDEPGAARPLGFSMGYGTGRRPSHVIVAERP